QGIDAKSVRSAIDNFRDDNGSADGGVVSAPTMNPFADGVMEQIERLKSEDFQATLREVQKLPAVFNMAPILAHVPNIELTAHAGAAVPELIALLEHSKPEVRYAAAQTLGRFGPAAAPAVPALVAHLRQDEDFIRNAALGSLTQIDSKGLSW